MKPSWLQYVLAHGLKLSVLVPPVALLASTVIAHPNWVVGQFTDLASAFDFIITVLGVLASGALIGVLVIWPIVALIAEKLNGSPFREGDIVRILVRTHRNKVVRVYEVWGPRHELRVELGEKEKEEVKDIFKFNEICRER